MYLVYFLDETVRESSKLRSNEKCVFQNENCFRTLSKKSKAQFVNMQFYKFKRIQKYLFF